SLRRSDGDANRSSEPLFLWLDEDRVLARPTYRAGVSQPVCHPHPAAAFAALLDNYELAVGVPESVTAEELSENAAFIQACLDTRPMRAAHRFLAGRGLASQSVRGFAAELDQIWFRMYKRDSSAFEHVFVGETRSEDGSDSEAASVTGAHNWLQLYLLERAGRLNYFGYYRRGTAAPGVDGQPGLAALKFSLDDGPVKPRGGGFVGVSPEFELALYTVAFLCCGGQRPQARIGPHRPWHWPMKIF
uniref:Uridylate-specific endoribonuclease n=1 Tax=Macrostomum lignano TaxID=282301 RepID=A0A1I8GP99_9PLAT